MRCSPRGSAACGRCELIPPGRQPAPSSARASRNDRPPSRPCASSTVFPPMPFMPSPESCGSAGWPTTSMPCSPRRWRPGRIVPSTASVWERPNGCVSKVGGAGSTASRTNAMIPDCALSCRNQKKGSYVIPWEGAEARLRAAHERTIQRANEGQVLPRSMGIPHARARLPKSRSEATQELLFLSRRGNVEAWKRRPELPVL